MSEERKLAEELVEKITAAGLPAPVMEWVDESTNRRFDLGWPSDRLSKTAIDLEGEYVNVMWYDPVFKRWTRQVQYKPELWGHIEYALRQCLFS